MDDRQSDIPSPLWNRWNHASDDERWDWLCRTYEVLEAIENASDPTAVQGIVERWRRHEEFISRVDAMRLHGLTSGI